MMIAAPLITLHRYIFRSWEDLAEALGVDVRTLGSHKGSARNRREVSAPLRKSVEKLMELHYPFPLPTWQEGIRRRVTSAKLETGSDTLLKVIEEIDGIVGLVTDASPVDAWNRAGLKYLQYLACHARVRLAGNNRDFGDETARRKSLDDATNALVSGRSIIAEALRGSNTPQRSERLRQLDVWLFLNWVVAIGSYLPEDEPPNAAMLAEKLKECDALSQFRMALETLPHEWRVAYNGLDVASCLGPFQDVSDDDLALFYRKLIDFDPGFEDFTYSPGEVLRIDSNPGLKYFRERFALRPNWFLNLEGKRGFQMKRRLK